MSMWKHQIDDNSDDVTVYYNAWENDDCESAILPILYHIISIMENSEEESFIEHVKFFLKILGLNTLKFSVNKLFGDYKNISESINNALAATDEKQIKTIFSEYDEYYGKRKKLQETLEDMVPKNGNLWIFIDDLDRCNPKFALETLECIKHFFNLKNIIFIFAIDYNQLAIATKQVYGTAINSLSYIKKFFDAIFQLPSPNRKQYIEYKINNIRDKNIIKLIPQNTLYYYFRKFDFSLRDIDLTMTHIELFFSKYIVMLKQYQEQELNSLLDIYFYFMAIKDKYPNDYINIIHGHFHIEEKDTNIWPVIDKKFLVNNDISRLLTEISNGEGGKYTEDIITKYNLMSIPDINVFSEHIEKALQ